MSRRFYRTASCLMGVMTMDNRISNLVDELLAGNNPIMVYVDTYAFKDEIKRRGYYETVGVKGKDNTEVYKGDPLQYRVNHGNGYITQNTLVNGYRNPIIEDINNE